MSRSRNSNQLALPEEEQPEAPPSRCVRFLYFLWKFCTCVFSHVLLVSLVVSYCILGAFTFEHLEADNERKVKSSISDIRGNVTEDIWKLTKTTWVLHQDNWTNTVTVKLRDFEKDILEAMRQKGWDGNEDPESIQWTFAGALFFSIIVITTIGYGHIAPKTHMGKVVTIFYAILGIPLMLLCLSNIGDVMATSFRFLYWRVCCYVCTRKPKKKRHRSVRGSTRQPRQGPRSRSASFKKPVRYSQKSADSGFAFTDSLPSHSYSDTDLRYHDDMPYLPKSRQLRISQMSRFSDSLATPQPSCSKSRGRGQAYGPNLGQIRGGIHGRTGTLRSQRSVPYSQTTTLLAATPSPRDSATGKRQKRSSSEAKTCTVDDVDERTAARSSILFNKYAIDDDYPPPRGRSMHHPLEDLDYDDDVPPPTTRSKSLPRQPRKDTYLDDDFNRGVLPKRDRSPRFEGECSRNAADCYSDRHYRSQRDFYVRDFMDPEDLKFEREFRLSKLRLQVEQGHRDNYEMDDLTGKRYRARPSPEPGLDKTTSLDRRNRNNRYDLYSDEEFENNPYDEDDPENYVSETELAAQRAAKQRKRERMHAPSARIMSPMGVSVHRQAKYMEDFDIEYAYEDGYYQSSKSQIKPVPIWLCVFLVVSYIIAGAFLFSHWEDWSFLDSAYFCFITLTTIGFGDFVPAQGVKANSEISIALCSLYLLFGISLLAMSFNLVQEEVIANVRSVAKRLGIIKTELGEESDDD
ncbi:potassium two pore domain channel subfamily K member galene isoform X2 [Arctopsyche grandis]|uniref:potassium two pore domain channel subfamily K member galene isoform X2 n=1 Tax=Arctopsyche grandis TaxID=121162 RepID=UPI00406D65B5